MSANSALSCVYHSLSIDPTIDVGHILTILALVGAVTTWTILTVREWRSNRDEVSKSGALRLLLYILRVDLEGQPIALSDLMAMFNAQTMKDRRIAYCKKIGFSKQFPSLKQQFIDLTGS